MPGRPAAVLKSIEQLFHQGSVAGLDDGELLERFAARRDEAAFGALVALHGPMVLGVCRRLLRDEHDVEDAFQATFLVLVKKAGSIRDAGRLGPWLHGVAHRVALRARSEAARRRAHRREHPASAEVDAMRPGHQAERDDVLSIIDEEVARLPARYRAAVVLCDLEGRSYAEAARRLRCPLGTLQSRLARGRARLRARLIRRGLAPVAALAILVDGARAAVPAALAMATVRAAVAITAGPAAGAVSATVTALVGSMVRGIIMMTMMRVAIAFAAGSIAIGAGLLARDALSAAGPPVPEDTGTSAVPAPAKAIPAPQPQPEQAEKPKPGRTLNLEVVDRVDNTPLPGATVWVRVSRGKPDIMQEKTDDEGRCAIALPDESHFALRVAATHPGFVPVELRWYRPEVPEMYTLALERGTPIGGTLRDEQGRPIGGARVFPRAGMSAPWDWPELAASPEDIAARTDDQGRWRSDGLPASAGPDVRLDVLVTHPDYIAIKQRIKSDEARARTNVLVLKTGRSVSGTVFSPTGRPIAGATIIVQHPHSVGDFVRIQTDARGRFHTGRFIDPTWAEMALTVQADGFASTMRQITNALEIPPQVIRLTPRRPLRGRVVDAQGRPIPGAVVGPTSEFGNGQFDWETETDTDGRFVWFEAPTAGMIYLNVSKPSFRQALGRQIDTGSREVTIVLHRAQRLHGTVTDAETGRPIERFMLIRGRSPAILGVDIQWARDQARTFSNGRFDLTGELSTDYEARGSIRIEADGYESAELIGFADNVEDVAHDFRLRKASHKLVPLSGIVRGPDGRPLAGVDVAVCAPGGDVRIENGRLTNGDAENPAPRFQTDRDGRYTFRPQEGRVWIAAAHDAGFAIRNPEQLAASADITLIPWGRIEGVMKIGTRPVSKQKVSAWLLDRGPLGRVDYDAMTDADGRFVLERVTPGRFMVYRYVDDADHHGWTTSNPVDVGLKPGETVCIQIGGTGRPVVGRLALPEGLTLANFVLGHGGNLSTARTWPPFPDDYPDWNVEQRSAWWDTFRKTPEGRAYFASFEREYAVALRPDGSFRIEDVPSGRYILKLPFSGTARDGSSLRAFARADVVVPEIPGGRSDEPLGIGVIPLDVFPFRELNVGDRVPEIRSKAADGRPLDLAALRGKFVLLAFWATYHGPTLASIPHLRATYDAFGRDPRLVIIGLNEDVNPDIMRRYVAHHGLAWEQRYLGSGDDPNPIAAAFGVRYPMKVFLIGPDGRLLAKDLQGDRIKQAVAAALK